MNQELLRVLPFGRSLAITAKTYFGVLTRRLAHLEIERYYSLLLFIESTENGCTQQTLCDQLKIDKVTMVRIIRYLMKKKFIQKQPNPSDRRSVLIQLSDKALQVLPQIHASIDDVNQIAFNGIPKGQQEKFYRNLTIIQANLETMPAQKIFINYQKSKGTA